jgi:transposase
VLSLPGTVRVFVATQAVDGRKGIDGLAALVRSGLGHDPLSGALFVFFSRRFDRARILYFSHNGYWLLSKRLERGRFRLPWDPTEIQHARPIETAQLQLILEGIDLRDARHRPRWTPHHDSSTGIDTMMSIR